MIHTYTIESWTIDDHPNQDAVVKWVQNNWPDLYTWASYNMESLNAFCGKFHLTDLDYCVSLSSPSYAKASLPPEVSSRTGSSAWTWLNNNVGDEFLLGLSPLTGYCFDETLLEEVRVFKKTSDDRTLQQLMDDCLQKWVDDYIDDWEYAYTADAIVEFCSGNEYEFLSDGSFFDHD